MTRYIEPKSLGLHSRTTIERVDRNTLAIVINRKSRIIMADGRKILDKALKIKKAKPGCTIIVKSSAPVCSKTMLFLAGHGIELIRE